MSTPISRAFKLRAKQTRMQRVRAELARVVTGLAVVAVAAFSVGSFGIIRLAPGPGSLLAAGTDFTVSSTITTWPSCSGSTALFYPGVTRCITYAVKNNLAAPITVKTISLAIDTTTTPTPPPGCNPSTNLDTSHASFSGSFAVGASPASASSPGLPIAMIDSGNQNACQGVTFHFTYTGTAQYTDPTTTALSSSTNPSNTGQPVTYTATVTPAVAQAVAGTVTFRDNGSVITSCGTSGAVTVNASGVAMCTVTYTSPGTHPITGAFTPSDATNFSSSVSNTVSQVVSGPGQACAVALSGTVTTITGKYKGDFEVKNGTSLYLNGGTISGSVQVDPSGKFVASGGSVSGNVVSQGGPSTVQGTNVGGYVQTSNASLGLGPGTSVKGKVQITGGGPVCIDGTTSGTVQIGGSLIVQQLPASTTVNTICDTTVGGDLTYSNDSQPAMLGGSSGCIGNTVTGNITVQSNSAKVSIGAAGSGLGNASKASISVQNNSGGGTLTNNSATNNCTLQSDSPGIVGSLNTAKGTNTCNRTA